MMNNQEALTIIDHMATNNIKHDISNTNIDEGKLLLHTLEQIYIDSSGDGEEEVKNREKLKKEIVGLKSERQEEFFSKLLEVPFPDDTRSEFMSVLQEYMACKFLTPKERELHYKFVELLKLFSEQELKDLKLEDKEMKKLFTKRINKKNKDLSNKKPIDFLKKIDPKFSIEDSIIKGIYM